MKHLQSNGVVVTAYCFDGFQVPLIRTLARSQAVAESFFMKSKAILNEQSQIGLPFHIGAGQLGSLVSEGSMGETMR